jgi:hypothetical protein
MIGAIIRARSVPLMMLLIVSPYHVNAINIIGDNVTFK